MSIQGYTAEDRDQFGKRLNQRVFPAHPIDRIEHLHGREKELDRIEKALFADGRNVFVYGDRGVGKSSLAATAAAQYQSADAAPIDICCSPNSTFSSLIANVAYQATKVSRLRSTTTNTSTGLTTRFFQVEDGVTQANRNLHDEIRSVTDAVEVLREAAQIHSEKPIVVLDEFDRIADPSERTQFADLLKQLGDKRIPIKLIITGVGSSLEELLGAHGSAIRQLETIELPRLGWEGRWDIIRSVAKAFGLFINRDEEVRIAAVSDGYPYYVHLVMEKLMWHLFEEPYVVTEVLKAHYQCAIRDAVASVAAELKRPYEMAIKQRSGDYEEVLWATADSESSHRYPSEMYSSYEFIMKQVSGKIPLDSEKFKNRIRSLKKNSCGAILVPDPEIRGVYTYREKMLRGYVRMQAEANGVQLIGEEASATDKQYMHVRVSSGYRTSSIPNGVHLGRKR